jgi:hypothetical protein
MINVGYQTSDGIAFESQGAVARIVIDLADLGQF